jgi:hypothetical protein
LTAVDHLILEISKHGDKPIILSRLTSAMQEAHAQELVILSAPGCPEPIALLTSRGYRLAKALRRRQALLKEQTQR